MEVTNTGNVPLTNLRLTAEFEQSLEPGQATAEWKQSGSSLYWTLESLPPGRKMLRQINFNCLQIVEQGCVQVNVRSAEGVTKDEQGCVEIQAAEEGTPPATGGAGADGRLSLSVADQVDPVAVGADTTHQVTITNGTNQPERNVTLRLVIPAELTLKEIAGPVQGGLTPTGFNFTPIAELRNGETVTFTLKFTARSAGTARLRTEVTSARQTQPISADETTEVVGAE
jgi:hypothetical protein